LPPASHTRQLNQPRRTPLRSHLAERAVKRLQRNEKPSLVKPLALGGSTAPNAINYLRFDISQCWPPPTILFWQLVERVSSLRLSCPACGQGRPFLSGVGLGHTWAGADVPGDANARQSSMPQMPRPKNKCLPWLSWHRQTVHRGFQLRRLRRM
jgi:hypothetical protein